MTIAEQFVDIFDGDGTSWTTPDGEEFADVIERLGGVHEDEGCSYEGYCGTYPPPDPDLDRYKFPDGSVIVTGLEGWDIEGERPFTWRGCEGEYPTIAKQVAALFDRDESVSDTDSETEDGVSFEDVIERFGAQVEYSVRTEEYYSTLIAPRTISDEYRSGSQSEHISEDPIRYKFQDGSAIVTTQGAWDIEGEQPFSWRG